MTPIKLNRFDPLAQTLVKRRTLQNDIQVHELHHESEPRLLKNSVATGI